MGSDNPPTKAGILIVEDEALVALNLKEQLERLGYAVSGPVSSGEAAIRFVENDPPDLILMDIVLAGPMDGIETSRVIGSRWDIPVVFTTAHADALRLERAKLAYPYGYLLKPYIERDLAITINMALHVNQVNQEKRREYSMRQAVEKSILGGITAVDMDGRQIYVNDAFCRMVGYSEVELLNKLPPFVYWPPAESRAMEALRSTVAGDVPQGGVELIFQKKTGEHFPVLVLFSRLSDGDRDYGWVAHVTDITQRKNTEELFKDSERRYRLLAENSTDMLIHHAPDGSMIYVSPSSVGVVGYSPAEVIGMPVFDFFHPADMKDAIGRFTQALTSRTITRVVYRVLHKNGHYIWLETDSKPYLDDEGRFFGIVAVSRDISDRKKIEDALLRINQTLEKMVDDRTKELTELNLALVREISEKEIYQNELVALNTELSIAREKERRAMATEIHDRLGQCLAVIKLKLQLLMNDSPSADKECMDEILGMVNQMTAETRILTFQLFPPVLHELGFTQAVEWLIEQTMAQHPTIKFKYSMRISDLALPDNTSILLFRAIKELLLNVVKHSKASRVHIAIYCAERLIITVEDNGLGFNSEDDKNYVMNGRFGLFTVKENMKSIGVETTFKSTPDQGTIISFFVPYDC